MPRAKADVRNLILVLGDQLTPDLSSLAAGDPKLVRPSVLTNFPATGRYQVLPPPTSWRNGVISRADVADFIVNRISAGKFNREKPVLIRYAL